MKLSVRQFLCLISVTCMLFLSPRELKAEIGQPSEKFEELLEEAQELFLSKRPIDARAKLQQALQINSHDYRPYMYLGSYYLSEVAHFPLAYRYLRQAESLFQEKYGSDLNGTLDHDQWKEHAHLLFLLSEARLNLDDYAGSLKTLDRFGALYWDDWYPPTRGWVLMKLKRVDEALMAVQAGLLRGAEPTRSYNILGILLSLKDNRTLALDAFREAIKAELALGGMGQAATPLNNAGEVYRELFRDDDAEASWIYALRLPDGCEHILPSLNLSILYTDELRLFQAERVLNDFVACFASRSLREDTEHRALLSLGRGKIALREGDPDKAMSQLELALDRKQWFGKIGTNAADLQFAAVISMSQALEAKIATLKDENASIITRLKNRGLIAAYRFRAWWLKRRARQIAVDELDSFKDLYIRNTDTMLEYPTIGSLISTFPVSEIDSRLKRLEGEDSRPLAHTYYDFYRAETLLAHGRAKESIPLLSKAQAQLRPLDRLAAVQVLTRMLEAKMRSRFWLIASPSFMEEVQKLEEQIYTLLPSHLRYADYPLPVKLVKNGPKSNDISVLLSRRRFSRALPVPPPRYTLAINTTEAANGRIQASAMLQDEILGQTAASLTESIKGDTASIRTFANEFIGKAFSHHTDPQGPPPSPPPILEGLLKE